MDRIKWCIRVRNGIELIDPNSNLAEAYLGKAEDSLETMRLAESRDWKISAAYYTMYFSLYAILMKIGIKCEIHKCTIECMNFFLTDHFDREEYELMKESLGARIGAQYFIDRNVTDAFFKRMMHKAPEFLVKCKSVVLKLDERKINQIRTKTEKMKRKG